MPRLNYSLSRSLGRSQQTRTFVPLLKVSRQKPSFKRDLKIFIETKKKSYLICYIKSTNLKHLSFLSLLSQRRAYEKAKTVPDTKQKTILLVPAADIDRNLLPIPVQTTTTTPRMMALVINETAKV